MKSSVVGVCATALVSILMSMFKHFTLAAAVCAGLALSAVGAQANTLNLTTGLDASGNLQTAGDSLDAHWQTSNAVSPKSAPNAYVVAPGSADWCTCWAANDTSPYTHSSWIAANPDDAYGNGKVTYTLDFYVSDPGSASITGGYWTIDDQGTLTLNGHQLASLGNGNWGSLWGFSTAISYFVPGLNQLVMTTTSSDTYLEGGRLQGTLNDARQVSFSPLATPLPAALPLFAGGLALLGLFARRRRRRNAIAAS